MPKTVPRWSGVRLAAVIESRSLPYVIFRRRDGETLRDIGIGLTSRAPSLHMPIPNRHEWIFAGGFPAERREYLETDLKFESIAERIAEAAVVEQVLVQTGTDGDVKGGLRPSFTVDVGAELCDLFFNGRDGYRARFWQDPQVGDVANRSVIDLLSPKLIRFAENNLDHAVLTSPVVRESLTLPTAKVWIANEAENGLGEPREAAPHLVVEQWERERPGDGPWNEVRPYRGYWAPRGTALDVKGAFLLPGGGEVVAFRKRNRSLHLHYKGFS
jgi:hypothetical protein